MYFEWSNGVEDWLNNFNFPAKPYRDMENLWFAHRGFLKVWKSIEPYVAERINDKSIKRFEVVGYSHGAAVALLCFEYVRYNRPDAEAIGVGFGSPRVVFGAMRRNVRKRFEGFTVVRNGKDIVTRMPPAILGFRHAGKLLKIGCPKGLIKDHYPENYKSALWAYEGEKKTDELRRRNE